MVRLRNWVLVCLALLALQVPWVQCVAACHEGVHPDIARDHCHGSSCDPAKSGPTKSGEADEESHSRHGELEHVGIAVATIAPGQANDDVPQQPHCLGDFPSAKRPVQSTGPSTASRGSTAPVTPGRQSAVLLL